MANPTSELSLGRLLRMQAMVTQAAQVEAGRDSAAALVHAYSALRTEMLDVLDRDSLAELRGEFDRLFPEMEEPPPFNPNFDPVSSHAKLAAAASQAQMGLRRLQGWIQGLIDEMTLSERMKLEAEARVKLENKPKPGF